jgi:hypothetical protein
MVLDKSGISIAPPKRTHAPEVKSAGPSMPTCTSICLWVKENSDTESSESGENIEENSENGEESGEESGEEESKKSGEEIEGGKVEVEAIEVDEVESPSAHFQPDTIDSAGLVGSDGSGPAGPVGPTGPTGPTGSAGPASITGYPGAAESLVPMPVISILPPTPVKTKTKAKLLMITRRICFRTIHLI